MEDIIQERRSSLIVTIPPEGFNENLTELKKEWIEFLETYKPLGVVFYTKHFKDKRQAKQMIQSIKNILGDNCFLSIDQEGGRVQRLYAANNKEWYNCPSAEELSSRYLQICEVRDVEDAENYVISEYRKMFKDMRQLGLNITFGPNCDINFYRDKDEYKQCAIYKKYQTKKIEDIKEDEITIYKEATLFKDYLSTVAEYIKASNNPNLGSEELQITHNKKEEIDKQLLELNLIRKFQEIAPYSGYISVVGNRSYGDNPELVARMAQLFVDAASKEGILCVPKHALGHGRPLQDTHVTEASTDASKEELIDADLLPYKKLFEQYDNFLPFVMPSHVKYTQIDPINIAPVSQKVLDLFKNTVGKENIIFISDDLGMYGAKQVLEEEQKLDKQYPKRQCDILLSGNGVSLEKVADLAKQSLVSDELLDKLEAIWSYLRNARYQLNMVKNHEIGNNKKLTPISEKDSQFGTQSAERISYYDETMNDVKEDFSLEKCFTAKSDLQQKIEDRYKAKEEASKEDEDIKSFNGNILVSFLEKQENGSYKFKLMPCKYADYLAAKTISPISLSGTVCLLLTADNPPKIVIGTKDIAIDRKDSLQFPCAFHNFNEMQLKALESLKRGKYSINNFSQEEGKRGLNEKLLKFTDDKKIQSIKPIGYNSIKVQDKEMITEYFELYQTNLTLKEIEQERSVKKPKDYRKLTIIDGISLQEITNILNNGCEIYFDGKNRKFAGELSSGLELIYKAMIDSCTIKSLTNQKILSLQDGACNKEKS